MNCFKVYSKVDFESRLRVAKSQGGNKALFYSPDMVDQRATIEGPVRVEAPGRNKCKVFSQACVIPENGRVCAGLLFRACEKFSVNS